MFSRSTGETEDLLGASGPSASSSVPGGSRRGVLSVHRGQLYYGDPAARPSGSVDSRPPPAASSGRRYQGGVSFDETLVDIMDSSSSDGEYSYVDPGSPMLGFSNNARARQATPTLSALSAGACAGPRGRTSPLGVAGTILAVAACAVLIVVGLVAAGAVDRADVIPAGVSDYFQLAPSASASAAAGADVDLRAGDVSGYIPRHHTTASTSMSSDKKGRGRSDRSDDGDDADETAAAATLGERRASAAPHQTETETDETDTKTASVSRGGSKTATGGARGDARSVGRERGAVRTSKSAAKRTSRTSKKGSRVDEKTSSNDARNRDERM